MSVAHHVLFRGRVQGVGFRAFVEQEAARAGVRGFVRNRRAGSVEAVFIGEAATVDALVAICRKGPSHARVDAVDRRDATPADLALCGREGFTVLPTV